MEFLTDRAPSLSEERLEKFEQKIGCNLPPEYREFLLKHNGGIPEPRLATIAGLGEDVWIGFFLGLDRPQESLDEWFTELSSELGSELLTIAIDGGGNKLLIDLQQGDIYYWDSNLFFSKSREAFCTYKVARSFSEMAEGFHAFPDDQISDFL